MEVFANHAHVFPAAFRQEGSVDALRRLMDACGIARAVCFAPFYEWGLDIDPNRWLAGELRGRPELFGFGAADLTRDDIEDQVEQIAALGLKGIKLHPAFQKFRIDGEAAKRAYAVAERLGLFLSFHTGVHWHRISDYHPLLFDELAHFFPGLRFSMEHVGGVCFFQDALAVMLNNMRKDGSCNVYAGLTSVFDNDMNRFWYQRPENLRDLLQLAGPKLCVFGLDFPYNGVDKVNEAIAAVRALQISEAEKALVLGGNLADILGVAP